MQTATLSEFCRIVKKVSDNEKKGMSSLVHIGEDHGTCEDTGKQHGGIPRYIGNGKYEKCGSELERPYRMRERRDWDTLGCGRGNAFVG